MTDTDETATDAARRFAQRLFAVERLCSGRPGYHTITVKALLTAMSDADDEPAIAPQPETRFGPQVQGCCPACGLAALFLGEGGYVTCANLPCQEPDAASTLLERRPAPQPETAPDRIVAYRPYDSRALLCRSCCRPHVAASHAAATPVTAEDLSHGGICDRCGRDLLVPTGRPTARQPETAPDAERHSFQDGFCARCGVEDDGWDLEQSETAHTACRPATAPDAESGTPDLREQYAAAIRAAACPEAEDNECCAEDARCFFGHLRPIRWTGNQVVRITGTPEQFTHAVLKVRDDALTTAQRATETAEHVARQNLDQYRQTYRDYQRLEAELAAARSQIDRLRTYATATELRHTEIRDHLATLDIRTRSDAWSLGAHIIAILDSPPDGLDAALTPHDTGQDGGDA